MPRYGKFSGSPECRCDDSFTCGYCLRMAGPTLGVSRDEQWAVTYPGFLGRVTRTFPTHAAAL